MELDVVNLSYTYPSGRPALAGVTFQVSRGERVAVIGPNGAGKSTLLLLLAGLLVDGTRAGEIIFGRHVNTDHLPEKDTLPAGLPARQAFLFQNPDDQIIGGSVEDDVGFSLLQNGVDRGRARELVGDVLRSVHLEGYEERIPLEMSFGEKKRMCLAGCLIGNPGILYLDEPALGLDPREVNQLLKILKGMDRTMLLASMDFKLVADLVDRIILLDRGQIVALGPVEDILFDHALMEAHGLSSINNI